MRAWWSLILLSFPFRAVAQDAVSTPSPSDAREQLLEVDVSTELPPVVANATHATLVVHVVNTTAAMEVETAAESASTNAVPTESTASQPRNAATVSSIDVEVSLTLSASADTVLAVSTETTLEPSPIIAEQALPTVPPPTAPDFLSFNEWREKYAAVPDHRAVRKPKKAAHRTKQDHTGAKPAMEDEAGQNGTLPLPDAPTTSANPVVPSDMDSQMARDDLASSPPSVDDATLSSVVFSPIQPLPDVGTGEPGDPLLQLKDRPNYAASECAAKVHRSSRQTKGASSILVEKKDRYMLTPCSSEPKFVEVELCDEIQIDTLVLANFELFSSMFKHFDMSCTVEYPGKPDTWHHLGQFRARNARGVQVFRPKPFPTFCRYIRINFTSHYGSEYYCPVSLLRVYGFTQLDAYRESERRKVAEEIEAARVLAALSLEGEDDEDDEGDQDEGEEGTKSDATSEPETGLSSAGVIAEPTSESHTPEAPSSTAVDTSISPSLSESVALSISASSAGSTQALTSSIMAAHSTSSVSKPSASVDPTEAFHGDDETIVASSALSESPVSTSDSPKPTATPQPSASESTIPPDAATVTTETGSTAIISLSATTLPAEETLDTSVLDSSDQVSATISALPEQASTTLLSDLLPTSSLSDSSPVAVSASVAESSPDSKSTSTSAATATSTSTSTFTSHISTATAAENASVVSSASSDSTTDIVSSASTVVIVQHTSTAPIHAETPLVSTRHVPRNESRGQTLPPVMPAPPPSQQLQPGESIYGTIMKRLSSLEHNQTLAMHYIEAQSRFLRETFLTIEHRLGEVEATRQRQELSFRQSLFDMEKKRGELELERLTLTSQVNTLAQEIRLERQLSIAQLVGVLALFVFVGATRGSPTSPFVYLNSLQAARSASLGPDSQREGSRPSAVPLQTEGFRRHSSHRANSLTTLGRVSSIKRTSVSSKAAPRRHYGNGTSKYTLRSPGPFTPPQRHASAPPDDLFAFSLSNALADDQRRRDSPRRRTKRQRSEEEASSAAPTLSRQLERDVGRASPRTTTSSSPWRLGRPAFFARPSAADDADTEPSDAPDIVSDAPPEEEDERHQGEAGYRTYSSDDEAGPPARSPPKTLLPRPDMHKRSASSPHVQFSTEPVQSLDVDASADPTSREGAVPLCV